jgi:hypothetical protein
MFSDTNNIPSPQKKRTYSEEVPNPTSNKFSNLIKPDFSPLIIKENKFIPKTIGSKKTKNNIEPDYPIKTADINLFSSTEIIGKDLFGIKKNKISKTKLNFKESGKKILSENNNGFFQKKFFVQILQNSDFYQIFYFFNSE